MVGVDDIRRRLNGTAAAAAAAAAVELQELTQPCSDTHNTRHGHPQLTELHGETITVGWYTVYLLAYFRSVIGCHRSRSERVPWQVHSDIALGVACGMFRFSLVC